MTEILKNVPPQALAHIPQQAIETLTGTTWFPKTLGDAFMPSLRISFYIGAALTLLAALLSAMRGSTYVHEIHSEEAKKNGVLAADGAKKENK